MQINNFTLVQRITCNWRATSGYYYKFFKWILKRTTRRNFKLDLSLRFPNSIMDPSLKNRSLSKVILAFSCSSNVLNPTYIHREAIYLSPAHCSDWKQIIIIIIPKLCSPLRIWADQPTAGLYFTCPQTAARDHLASWGTGWQHDEFSRWC